MATREAVEAALASVDLAAVLHEHSHSYDSHCTEDYGCACGATLPPTDDQWEKPAIYAHQAEVVKAAILAALS